jgi:anaerobic magnesium-protoporphyrin IX monomethyl ester cyclase
MADVMLAKLDSEKKEYSMAPPFGILYLADALEKAGFSVRLIHELGTEADIQALVELVSVEKPLLVGFSTLTGPSLLPTAQASKAIKETQPVPVVWGGLHPTMLPQQTLMNDFIDIVAIGEGERTIVELAGVLREHGPEAEELAKVAGIAFKSDGKVVLTKPRPFIKDLDDLHPAWHHVDIGRYFSSGKHFYTDVGSQFWGEKIAAVFTSRGCPWRCGFCYNQFVNKRTFRPHSAQRVIKDIQDYKERYGITAFIFEDDCFFTNKDRALEIIRHIGVPWTCSIRANYLTRWGDDFVSELKQHNCAELRIGAESGSQRVLDMMNKDITVDQIRTAAELCLKHGVKPSLGFMVGIPGESWSDVLQTLELMDELEKMGDGIAVIGPCIFTPYPGTPLFELAIEQGFKPPASLEQWGIRIWDHKQPLAPYVDRRIRLLPYYRRLAKRTDFDQLTFSLPTKILRQVARLRWRYRFFHFPLDYTLPAFGLNMLTKLGLADMHRKLRKAMWKT